MTAGIPWSAAVYRIPVLTSAACCRLRLSPTRAPRPFISRGLSAPTVTRSRRSDYNRPKFALVAFFLSFFGAHTHTTRLTEQQNGIRRKCTFRIRVYPVHPVTFAVTVLCFRLCTRMWTTSGRTRRWLRPSTAEPTSRSTRLLNSASPTSRKTSWRSSPKERYSCCFVNGSVVFDVGRRTTHTLHSVLFRRYPHSNRPKKNIWPKAMPSPISVSNI